MSTAAIVAIAGVFGVAIIGFLLLALLPNASLPPVATVSVREGLVSGIVGGVL